MRVLTKGSLVVCFLLSIFAAPILAQAPVGTISGTVVDESGAIIPNAVVTIRNKATYYANALNEFSEQARSEASIRFLRRTRGGLDKTLLNTQRAQAMSDIVAFLLRGDFRSPTLRAEVIASFREWPEASVWWGLLVRLNSFYMEPLPAKLFGAPTPDESDKVLLHEQFAARLKFLEELTAAVHAPNWPNEKFWDKSIEDGRTNLSRTINRLSQTRR